MSTIEGYLVVLRHPNVGLPFPAGYRGIYRMPPYPSDIEEEQEAIDDYVFNSYYKDEELDLILSLARAKELLSRFAESSRKYEIIYCRTNDGEIEANPTPEGLQLFGYDVACLGSPFWSIIADFWQENLVIDTFAKRLNANGLFSFLKDAKEYLEAYEHLYPNPELLLVIWEIYLVP